MWENRVNFVYNKFSFDKPNMIDQPTFNSVYLTGNLKIYYSFIYFFYVFQQKIRK